MNAAVLVLLVFIVLLIGSVVVSYAQNRRAIENMRAVEAMRKDRI